MVSDTAKHRRGRWVVAGVVVLLVAWGAVVAAHVWSAYRHDQRGLAELTTVRANLDPTTVTAASTASSLHAAAAEFSSAHASLSGPLVAPATWIPVLGRQLRSARALSAAAEQVSTVGATFLGQVHSVLDQPHGAGPERVASLRRLAALSLAASHQLDAVDTGPGNALVAPLARKHDEFVAQLDDARHRLSTAASVSAVVATILEGPQTYLLLAGNNAEMRAGSGSVLDVGTADTSAGTVHLGQFGPSGELGLARGQVVVTGDLERNWGWLEPGVDWRNLGLTPQFPVNAELASRMWAARTGQQVSGVLAIDVVGLRQILTATGPVQAAGQTVDADNVEQYLLHDQYIGLSDNSDNLAQAQIDKYTAAINQINTKIIALQAQEAPGSPNAALVATQISALTQTSSTLQAAQSTIQIGMPYAQVQVAAGPGGPTGLSTSKLALIGLIAGFLVGCGIAFIRDQFDDRVRVSPDIESVIDGPLLGELPQDADVRKGEVSIALVQAPQSSLAEAVRDLRTSLRVLLVEQQSPILVITSPEPGDGKTFVTANLAVSWALTGSRVIVVSADFRRPRLEDAFGIDATGSPGLSDLIKANWKQAEPDDDDLDGLGDVPGSPGRRDREDERRAQGRHSSVFGDTAVSTHLLETGIDGLQLLPVGVHLDNPAELFDSPGMQPVLDQLHLLADIVLLDTPPVLAAPDTAILGSLTHGAVVVASEGKTDRADLERTANRLEATGCRVVGLVLNHVRRTTSDSYQAYTSNR